MALVPGLFLVALGSVVVMAIFLAIIGYLGWIPGAPWERKRK